MIELPIANTEETRQYRFGDCEACPLQQRVVRGYGKGGGLAIVGESPGTMEIDKGRPFVGLSGKLVRAVLENLGYNPEDAYWTNALLCHSPMKPGRDAVVACNNRLHEELEAMQVKKVLLLGGIALQAFMNPLRPISILKYRGKGYRLLLGKKPAYMMPTIHPAAVLRSTDMFRDLVNDIQKFLSQDDLLPKTRPHVYVSWNEKQALRRLPKLMKASKLSCDLETTGFSTVDDDIISVGFGVERANGEYESHIIPSPLLKNPRVQPLILDLLLRYPGRMILHNAKFDLRFLQALYGIKMRPMCLDDTMLMSYILDERPASPHGLKALARYHFDAEDYSFDFDSFLGQGDHSKEDYEKLFYYQGLDCFFTLRLHHFFAEKMAADPTFRGRDLLDKLLYPATYAFLDIENNGVPLNVPYLEKWQVELEQEVEQTKARISKLVMESTGIKEWSKDGKPFNPGSALQMKRLIYDIWKTPKQMKHSAKSKQWKSEVGSGEWPTGQTILSRVAEIDTDPVHKEVLLGIRTWRMSRTLLATYVKGLRRAADSDGHVRSFFFLHGTVTGRLSSTRPNLQNIPSRRGRAVEKAFDPGEGWSIIAADYSQLELRVLAAFTEDPDLLDIFQRGLDIHSESGSRIFNKPAEEISFIERKMTKTIVFGILYGRGAESILLGHEMAYLVREGLGVRWTKEDAQKFQHRFLNSYPGMKAYFERVKRKALENHYVETPTGRRRRFPFVTQQNKPEILRQAVNAPIQGSASDICLDGLVRLHSVLPPDDAHLLSMIHDAVLIECRDSVLEDVLKLTKSTMEDVQIIDTPVPFKISIKVGPNWGEVKDVMLFDDGSIDHEATAKKRAQGEKQGIETG